MKPEQKKAINRTILQSRAILERDIENRLVIYGILMDEPWIEKDKLSLSDEQEQIYKNLREAIGKEMKGGLSQKEALISYIREVTYTNLNRIAALRVMEVRGLIEEVLIQREEYGGRSYGHRNFFEIAREYCKSQSDEGLSYFISLIFNEIASDIGLLFNTEDEYSIICPSNQALLEIIHLLTTEIDEESWQQDEIIGWIYQYFNEEEKKDVFERTNNNKKEKIESIDIPAATQLFTPDWIVEWIVNNSLGKLREEILKGERENKKLEEIKLLDPACGSGHFLVKAYDLFYQYYVEDGYPKEKIPYLILKHNLFGIDIDARAIQITALILFIKLRESLKIIDINTINENITVNLVCADAVLLNGDRLAKLKKQFENNDTILEMIDIIYEEFTDTRIKGSLIQPEKKLIPLIEKYKKDKQKKLFKKQKTPYLDLFENDESFLKEQEENILSQSEKQLFRYLEEIYSHTLEAKNINNLLFANEIKKSVKLVNIFMEKFDVVVGNPPYMGSGNMNDALKNYVQKNFSASSEDLYAVFIQRSLEFLQPRGFLSMIVQQGFMFTSKYKKLRELLLNNTSMIEVIHLGTNVFEELMGEKVNNVMFSLKEGRFNTIDTTFIDLTNSNNKEVDLKNRDESFSYKINIQEFRKIKGSPFLYKLDKKIINYFQGNLFDKVAHVQRGLSTGNNNKFIRYFWEVKSMDNWKYICKISGNDRYLSPDNVIVKWEKESLNSYRKNGNMAGEDYYFKKGIFYPRSPYKAHFSAKLLKEDTIIEDGKPGIFPYNHDVNFILGFLNSNLIIFFLDLINPTNNFQVGDLNRVPFVDFPDIYQKEISQLVSDNIKLKEEILSYDETTRYFNIGNYNFTSEDKFEDIIDNIISRKNECQHKIVENDKRIDEIVYEVYQIQSEQIDFIESQLNIKEKKSDYYNSDLLKETLNILSIVVGIIFNRWKMNQYKTESDGIIILNEKFVEEVLTEAFEVIFRDSIVDELIFDIIPNIIGKDILEWFLKNFFDVHRKKYEQRPIYWHICSPNKTFNALLYYHELNSDTLYKLKSNYLKPIIENLKGDLNFYRGKISSTNEKKVAKQYEKRVVELENQINDLETLDRQIDDIIASGYEPDINQGVLYNIKPLNPILAKKIEK